ncbi:MAG TPA: S1 RNA-binding domain-containing protein [Anaerolineae bacterium]|nr:S1 RNA-binding domain-containing protein [Anaerolineae bacterium]HQK14181.1 S1 RNA-binding domain-containing protein [Anaerolineae bacterium]
MDRYIPPHAAPCEDYWEAILEEGPLSFGQVVGAWEWVEAPEVPMAVWDEARQLQRTHTILELAIDGFNRGGLMTHWKGVECFVPASHLVNYPFPADPAAREKCFEAYLGKPLRLCIIEVEPARNRILLSERLVAECETLKPEWPEWLCVGRVCTGKVTSVRPFGAFVDIGPLEGMVHISEISWGRVRRLEDFLTPGQDVRVKILNVDPEHQRVGLSLKRLSENPWLSVHTHIKVGDVLVGTVASIERFGIFVELINGLEGLLHISELEGDNPTVTLQDHFSVGQSMRVRILEIVPEEHRIALGLVDGGFPHATA